MEILGALFFFLQVLAIIVVTIIITNLLIELDIFSRFKFLRVDEDKISLLIFFSTCFLNVVAAYMLLVTVREKVNIDVRELYPLLILTSPIAHISETVRLIAPLSLALFGLNVGLLFTAIMLARAFLRLALHALLVRLKYVEQFRDVLKKVSLSTLQSSSAESSEFPSIAIKRSLHKSLRILRKLIPKLLIAFLIVVVLNCTGLLSMLAHHLDPLLISLGLTHAMIIVVLSQLALYIPGMYIAATLFMSGELTVKELITALLVGALLHRAVSYIRIHLPLRAALFNLNIAVRWVLIDIITDVSTCILMILIVSAIL